MTNILFAIVLSAGSALGGASYDRELYPHWLDTDRDCQDTRNEVLVKYSQVTPKYKSAKRCEVLSGKWKDPYSNKIFKDPHDLDVDHVVTLKFAHVSGAVTWPKARKALFANDMENLLPVALGLNRAKSDKAPSEWMPPNKVFECRYLTLWKGIIGKYRLRPLKSEMDFINDGLRGCRVQAK